MTVSANQRITFFNALLIIFYFIPCIAQVTTLVELKRAFRIKMEFKS